MVLAAELQPTDTVLEIGPGLGVLTQELTKRVKRVIALEKDAVMCEILKETLLGFDNVKIIRGDILKFEIWKFFENRDLEIGNFKVVANLPFYLTASVIRSFLESKNLPKLMVFIVQKEVAQRICVKPPKMNLLAVSVQFYAKPKIISYVSKKSFWPSPKVDSAIIKILPYSAAQPQFFRYGAGFREQFFKIVRSGFSQPRKQIVNNLSKMLKSDKEKVKSWLLENNIKPEQRAETLTLKNWFNLAKSFDEGK